MKVGIAIYHDNCEKYPSHWIQRCMDSIITQTAFKKRCDTFFGLWMLNYAASLKMDESTLYVIVDRGRLLSNVMLMPYRKQYLANYATAMNYLYDLILLKTGCDVVVNVNIDDFYAPDRIELLLQEIERGTDIVSSNYVLVDENEREIRRTDFAKLDVSAELRAGNNIISNPGHAMTRKVFEQLKFKPELVPREDLEYWNRCIDAGFSIKILPEHLHYYRIHANQSGNV